MSPGPGPELRGLGPALSLHGTHISLLEQVQTCSEGLVSLQEDVQPVNMVCDGFHSGLVIIEAPLFSYSCMCHGIL